MSTEAAYDVLLTDVFRGHPIPWPADRGTQQRILDAISYHDIGPLVYQRLREDHLIPNYLKTRLKEDVHYTAAVELFRRREITSVVGKLERAGISLLLLKGTPLAYTLYPSPVLRPRGDTDLLVRKSDVEATSKTLAELGYISVNAVQGELVSSQACFKRRDPNGVTHTLDVHWRINNAQRFARTLDFDELERDALMVEALGPEARTLSRVHALLLACLHRKSHMQAPYYVNGLPTHDGDRLIWLYDIYLLSQGMSQLEWEDFTILAEERNLTAVCIEALMTTEIKLGSLFPEDLVIRMATLRSVEPRYCQRELSNRLEALFADLQSLPRWHDRMTLLKEHLFPPQAYMLQCYSVTNRCLLPWLYLWRATRGIVRFLTPFRRQ